MVLTGHLAYLRLCIYGAKYFEGGFCEKLAAYLVVSGVAEIGLWQSAPKGKVGGAGGGGPNLSAERDFGGAPGSSRTH
jgi:hypothetical protein